MSATKRSLERPEDPPRTKSRVKVEEPTVSMSSSTHDAPTLEEWKLLTLPRSMKTLSYRVHVLDRQFRAALYDVTRLTELFMLVSALPEQKDGTMDITSLPPPLAMTLPPTRKECLLLLDGRIQEQEQQVMKLALEKKGLTEQLHRLVTDATQPFLVHEEQ